jgi:hypothetical protein
MNYSRESQQHVMLVKSPTANLTFLNMDALLTDQGFSYELSLLYITLFLTAAFIGIVMNSVSLHVLFAAEKFKITPLYIYLRVTTLSSLILNIYEFMFAFTISRQFVSFSNSHVSQWLICYVLAPGNSLFFLYKCVLDALIVVDRIAIFKQRVKYFYKSFSPMAYCTIAFAASLVLCAHYLFIYEPTRYEIVSSDGVVSEFFTLKITQFASTRYGKTFTFLLVVLRSSTICLVDFVLNVVSLVIFKDYLFKKSMLVTSPDESQTMIIKQEQASSAISRTAEEEHTPSKKPRTSLTIAIETAEAERNISMMVIVMCSVSVLHQLALVGKVFYMPRLTSHVRSFGDILEKFLQKYSKISQKDY